MSNLKQPYFLPPNPNYKFPHLLKPERELLKKFMLGNAKRIHGAMYDVRVGNGIHPLDPQRSYATEIAFALTTHRIDAVFDADT